MSNPAKVVLGRVLINCHVRYSPVSDRKADIQKPTLRAMRRHHRTNSRSSIIRCLSNDTCLARTVPPSQRVEEIQDGSAEAHRVLDEHRMCRIRDYRDTRPRHMRGQGVENYRQ